MRESLGTIEVIEPRRSLAIPCDTCPRRRDNPDNDSPLSISPAGKFTVELSHLDEGTIEIDGEAGQMMRESVVACRSEDDGVKDAKWYDKPLRNLVKKAEPAKFKKDCSATLRHCDDKSERQIVEFVRSING